MRRGVNDTYGAGLETIDQWIARLRSAPEMVSAGVEMLAQVAEADIKRSIAAKQSPDGKPWKPFKKGTGLSGAASAISTAVRGNVVQIILTGVNVFHHFGTRRDPRRPMLPMGGMPDRLGNAIRKGLVDLGVEWMTRRGRHDKSFGKGAKPKAVSK